MDGGVCKKQNEDMFTNLFSVFFSNDFCFNFFSRKHFDHFGLAPLTISDMGYRELNVLYDLR